MLLLNFRFYLYSRKIKTEVGFLYSPLFKTVFFLVVRNDLYTYLVLDSLRRPDAVAFAS